MFITLMEEYRVPDRQESVREVAVTAPDDLSCIQDPQTHTAQSITMG